MKISVLASAFNVIETLPDNMFRLCIENMYDFVDEIIIVEGATKSTTYFDGDTSTLTGTGISRDGTVELLKEIEEREKIKVIYGTGFWDGRTSMCNAGASIATGDYLWLIDADEFYKRSDITMIKKLLETRKPNAVHFFANHFFGDWYTCIDERNPADWGNNIPWKRIFRNVPGKSEWARYEPPIYVCDGISCDEGDVVTREETLAMGIKLWHYSYVQESQIKFKTAFFRNPNYPVFWEQFKQNKNIKVFDSQLHELIGDHPQIIKENYL